MKSRAHAVAGSPLMLPAGTRCRCAARSGASAPPAGALRGRRRGRRSSRGRGSGCRAISRSRSFSRSCRSFSRSCAGRLALSRRDAEAGCVRGTGRRRRVGACTAGGDDGGGGGRELSACPARGACDRERHGGDETRREARRPRVLIAGPPTGCPACSGRPPLLIRSDLVRRGARAAERDVVAQREARTGLAVASDW